MCYCHIIINSLYCVSYLDIIISLAATESRTIVTFIKQKANVSTIQYHIIKNLVDIMLFICTMPSDAVALTWTCPGCKSSNKATSWPSDLVKSLFLRLLCMVKNRPVHKFFLVILRSSVFGS